MFDLVLEETYEDGQMIIKGDTPGDWIYVILSGEVEISREVGGTKFVVGRLKEGEIFGELSFLAGIKRMSNVQAVGKTTVGLIDKEPLDEEFNQLDG